MMVSSTGTFVSCKDYDDDIDQEQINKELTELNSQIAALQATVDTRRLCNWCGKATAADVQKGMYRLLFLKEVAVTVTLEVQRR
ncbi:hypothetical protein NXY07_08030 [Phocaeicola dorei]|nr:hypothetical protein [Phocaeicola dorei]